MGGAAGGNSCSPVGNSWPTMRGFITSKNQGLSLGNGGGIGDGPPEKIP